MKKNKYIMNSEEELTLDKLKGFIDQHKTEVIRLQELENLYIGDHLILNQQKKEKYKPDNRLVSNFAKYIVDTFNGFFIGKPIKTSHEKENVEEYLNYLKRYNNQDDNNSELSKLMSIYGKAYELLFLDEEAEIGITYIDPKQAFIIVDNSIRERTLYGVRYYIDSNGDLNGTFSDSSSITYFKENEGKLLITDQVPHYFGEVPLIEYQENAEELGIFENVETLINAYNKALSEKANDVDYFADAYLKILGGRLEESDLKTLRDSRIINLSSADLNSMEVNFLDKPNSDGTQENLINRLEKLIFQNSMVANINEENFGNASGISLKYKLQSMLNLAATKERKFKAGLNKRYKLIALNPASPINLEDWIGIEYHFTRNIPNNALEEAEIANKLMGITSIDTQLKVLSVVDNVEAEKGRILKAEEERFNALNTEYTGGGLNGREEEKEEN